MAYFLCTFLVDRFCHLCAFTDNGIGGVDGGRGEVALIMEFLCGLFHFFHLDGSGGSVIDISISAGAVRKLFYRNEFQYVVAIGGRLVPCFSKVNGNGFAVLPQFSAETGMVMVAMTAAAPRAVNNFFIRFTHFQNIKSSLKLLILYHMELQ